MGPVSKLSGCLILQFKSFDWKIMHEAFVGFAASTWKCVQYQVE